MTEFRKSTGEEKDPRIRIIIERYKDEKSVKGARRNMKQGKIGAQDWVEVEREKREGPTGLAESDEENPP